MEEDGVMNADEKGELESKDGMLDTYEREGLGSEDGMSDIEEREMLDSEYRDGSVDFNCGLEGVKNDEFVATENKAENDFIEEQNHVCDGRISLRNYFDLLPLELLEAILLHAIMTSDFLFPNHACRT